MTGRDSHVEPGSRKDSARTAVNPYATSIRPSGLVPNPAGHSDPIGTVLAFDGEIIEEDIRKLIPERGLWILLAALMWGMIIPAFAIGIVVATTNVFFSGVDFESVLGIVLCALVAIGFAVATQYVSPSRRARRALKQRPDLLSRASGRFVPSGILFDDGERTHFLNEAYCQRAATTKHGVRVPLLEGPYVQLYLAKRLFEQFDETVWKELQTIWHQSAVKPLDRDAVLKRNCQQLGERPESAISFNGQVTLHVPVDHAAVRKIMYRNGGMVVVHGVATLLAWHFGHWFIALGALMLALSALRYFYNSWRWTAIPTQETTWQQHGWISPDEVVSVTETNGVRLSRRECQRTEWIDETLVWHLRNNRAMYFSREHFESDEDWDRVSDSSSSESIPAIE